MWSNTKLLIIACLLIIISGFSILWFGVKSPSNFQPQSSSTPLVESLPEATVSKDIDADEDIEGDKVMVVKVVDGDTIELESGLKVRLLGIDTPETVDPRRPVGCFGKEASNKLKSLIEGQQVILEKDVSETDKYKRLLRYVYLPLEGGRLLFINDYLVREGYAQALTYPPDVKYTDQFLEAQRQAKNENKGLWGRC